MSEQWQHYSIRELAENAPQSFTDGDWVEAPHIRESGIRLIQTGNIGIGHFIDRSKKYISQTSFDALNCKEVFPGDLLICRLAEPIGRACFAPDLGERMITSVDVTILRVDKTTFDTRFIAFGINTPEALHQCEVVAGGTTRQRISRSNLGKVKIKAPKVGVQRQIAEILSTLDEMIEQTEALIAKMQQVKAGLMHDLFTRGVTHYGHLRPTREHAPNLYKESPLGWIPKEWEAELLDSLAQRGSGHTPNKNHPEFWDGGIKWVSLADSWRLDRVHISETDKEISEQGIGNSSAVLHPPGIVVLSRDAGVGKSAITTCSMAVSQHFMCWRCGPQLDNYYLYYWLQDKKREFENIATGSTIPTIGLRFFKHYRINVPREIEEQKQIGETLLSLDQSIFELENDANKLKSVKHGLMHDLLTGRVRMPEDLRLLAVV